MREPYLFAKRPDPLTISLDFFENQGKKIIPSASDLH